MLAGLLRSLLFYAAAPTDTVSRPAVHAALRANLPFFAIACVVLIAGAASLLLSRLRSRDRLLFWLGIFSLLYGLRLLLLNELVRASLGLSFNDVAPWVFGITYVISLPYALFARELFGRAWRRAFEVWYWAALAFAVFAVPFAFSGRPLNALNFLNSALVTSGTLLLLIHLLWRRSDPSAFARSLTWPLVICGLLILLQNRGIQPWGFNTEPVGFLILLAGLGWVAVRRSLAISRRLSEVEQELATARRIQDSIIPRSSPQLLSLSVASRYQPMTSVAGDFFDFLKTGDTRLTILVADVSGHGVPAALVASMLKVCFAAQRPWAHDPAQVLAGLNSMLRDSLGGQYVTAACAAIDLSARVITYSGAGHPPTLLMRRQAGEVIRLAENGLFIGPFPQATYSNVSVSFESGDKLLLYTDGIVEATGPDGVEFGQDTLERFLQSAAHLAPGDFIEQLFRRISTPAQQDDWTAVVAQFD
ncbi:MAG: PP2C family protein-serine/threonine phosphatase [Acidobacteriaceae bacterium]|nr:PP2C family protein-serine/threonine phosphatase [Acidobacteriaceae bacterium]